MEFVSIGIFFGGSDDASLSVMHAVRPLGSYWILLILAYFCTSKKFKYMQTSAFARLPAQGVIDRQTDFCFLHEEMKHRFCSSLLHVHTSCHYPWSHMNCVFTDEEYLFLCSVCQLLVTTNVPSSLILSTLITEVVCSFKTSVLTRATWHHIPENDILRNHHCEEPQILHSESVDLFI
jgi:hypothetical protein